MEKLVDVYLTAAHNPLNSLHQDMSPEFMLLWFLVLIVSFGGPILLGYGLHKSILYMTSYLT